ncbi:hypothetical protein [Gayadomonas joobiniege]|uniref:hypothetical protein n=1 Tax=Gayadomonas joobiniege TaxID=1234606 RepID=UPI00036B668B|nr:hypothetical protein [Gayadomonas joobiniege]
MSYGILSRGVQTRNQALGLMSNSARQETQRNMQNDQLKRAEKTEKVSGTIGGATTGAMVGGPVGAVVGAVAGYALTELF